MDEKPGISIEQLFFFSVKSGFFDRETGFYDLLDINSVKRGPYLSSRTNITGIRGFTEKIQGAV